MSESNFHSSEVSVDVSHRWRWVFLSAAVVIFGAAWMRVPEPLEWRFQTVQSQTEVVGVDMPRPDVEGDASESPMAVKRFIPNDNNYSVHASTIVALPDQSLLAFWYGGTREGHRDVSIRTSRFDSGASTWSPDETVMTVAETQRAEKRFIKKLGNPVAMLDGDQKMWLFYVSVSLGGWSGASANYVTSTDQGETWSAPAKIVSSPFLNMCTQLKSRPFLYADGTIGLPTHHEMELNFSSIVRLDLDGNVLAKRRLSHGKTTMQPMPLIMDEENAVVLMRYHAGETPRAAPMTRSTDGGLNWSAIEPSAVPNQDSALTGLTLDDGTLLVACNDQTAGRSRLSLLISRNQGASWQHIYHVEYDPVFDGGGLDLEEYRQWFRRLLDEPIREMVEDPDALTERAVRNSNCETGCAPRFAYPYIIQRGSSFHLLYTWNRAMIAEFEFNTSWLEEQIRRAAR